jgi:hypothetical protein
MQTVPASKPTRMKQRRSIGKPRPGKGGRIGNPIYERDSAARAQSGGGNIIAGDHLTGAPPRPARMSEASRDQECARLIPHNPRPAKPPGWACAECVPKRPSSEVALQVATCLRAACKAFSLYTLYTLSSADETSLSRRVMHRWGPRRRTGARSPVPGLATTARAVAVGRLRSRPGGCFVT